jgi:exodeoxyribonuclease X
MDYKLLFFDTETTGNEDKDYLCQLAYKDDKETRSELFLPPVPISIESMAVHHITQKMVADKPAFKFSLLYKDLHDRAHDGKTVFIAHNAPFDLKMLKKEGIIPEKYICTLRVARTLDEEGKISSYRLQYLRYLLGIEIEATAHDALGDVLVLEKLFERLFKKLQEKNKTDDRATLEEMINISSHPVAFKRFNFGKHAGKLVSEVASTAPDYLDWLYKQKKENEADEEDWLYTLEQYRK